MEAAEEQNGQNPRMGGTGVYIVARLVWVRLDQLVRSDWASWVCAKSTLMLIIGVG
jgi:hypothetical protein